MGGLGLELGGRGRAGRRHERVGVGGLRLELGGRGLRSYALLCTTGRIPSFGRVKMQICLSL
jgi:hypothetical protein